MTATRRPARRGTRSALDEARPVSGPGWAPRRRAPPRRWLTGRRWPSLRTPRSSRASTSRTRQAFSYGSGCGLPQATSSPATDTWKEPAGSRSRTASSRTRYEAETKAHGMPASTEARRAARGRPGATTPPGSRNPASTRASIWSTTHAGFRSCRPMNIEDVGAGVQQRVADQLFGVGPGPGGPERVDQVELGGHPQRLGVGQCPVEVPKSRLEDTSRIVHCRAHCSSGSNGERNQRVVCSPAGTTSRSGVAPLVTGQTEPAWGPIASMPPSTTQEAPVT